MDVVSIVIPTLNRPACLARAIASALAQQGDPRLEIVVIDNSADSSARADHPTIRILREPRPGIANARNAGVAAARGEWIAFLDDDEEASPRWIANLLAVARRTGADAVFGPIEARAEGGKMGGFSPYFSRTLAAADGADITTLSAHLGTNNSMFHRGCLDGAEPFDIRLNAIGGEDSLLIERLKLGGRRFAWAARASVIEWAPPRRLTWAYVRKRKFLSGQIRVFVQRMASPSRWDRIAVWMGIGLAQFVLAGVAALALRPLAPDRSARARATAWGGLGKVLWQARFRPTLYGAGLVS